jgi:2-methylcitrate dehydratase PrpD
VDSRRPHQLGELTEEVVAGAGVGGAARRASPYRAAWVVGAAEAEGWSI